MVSELQRLVENLGRRLGRSVAIDDPDMKLLAYNSHANEFDVARAGSIMRRSVPRELVEHVYAHGAGTAADLFTVPPCPEFGLDIPRIGMPVHYQGELRAFVWLLASDGPVTAEQCEAVRRTAETVGIIMHREYLLGALTRGQERELTRDLLDESAAVRASAAEQLLADHLFASGPALALVVEVERPGSDLSDQDRLALAAGAEFGRVHRAQRHALTLERPDHAIVLLTHADANDAPVAALGTEIRERVLAEATSGCSCWVGVGAARPELTAVHASYAEARRAAGIARVVRALGPVVRYADLGVYGMLAEMPADKLTSSLPPGLRRLFDSDRQRNDVLVQTLETFLDNAGDVTRTAEELHIHRTSLYYRLRSAEKITGLDLSVGDQRLALHLGLKVALLTGLRGPR